MHLATWPHGHRTNAHLSAVSKRHMDSPGTTDKTDTALLPSLPISLQKRNLVLFSLSTLKHKKTDLCPRSHSQWRSVGMVNMNMKPNCYHRLWGHAYNNTFKEENTFQGSLFSSFILEVIWLFIYFSNLTFQRVLTIKTHLIGTLRNLIFPLVRKKG